MGGPAENGGRSWARGLFVGVSGFRADSGIRGGGGGFPSTGRRLQNPSTAGPRRLGPPNPGRPVTRGPDRRGVGAGHVTCNTIAFADRLGQPVGRRRAAPSGGPGRKNGSVPGGWVGPYVVGLGGDAFPRAGALAWARGEGRGSVEMAVSARGRGRSAGGPYYGQRARFRGHFLDGSLGPRDDSGPRPQRPGPGGVTTAPTRTRPRAAIQFGPPTPSPQGGVPGGGVRFPLPPRAGPGGGGRQAAGRGPGSGGREPGPPGQHGTARSGTQGGGAGGFARPRAEGDDGPRPQDPGRQPGPQFGASRKVGFGGCATERPGGWNSGNWVDMAVRSQGPWAPRPFPGPPVGDDPSSAVGPRSLPRRSDPRGAFGRGRDGFAARARLWETGSFEQWGAISIPAGLIRVFGPAGFGDGVHPRTGRRVEVFGGPAADSQTGQGGPFLGSRYWIHPRTAHLGIASLGAKSRQGGGARDSEPGHPGNGESPGRDPGAPAPIPGPFRRLARPEGPAARGPASQGGRSADFASGVTEAGTVAPGTAGQTQPPRPRCRSRRTGRSAFPGPRGRAEFAADHPRGTAGFQVAGRGGRGRRPGPRRWPVLVRGPRPGCFQAGLSSM